MQSIKTHWAVALCLTTSCLTGSVLADEAAEQPQAEAVAESVDKPVAEPAAEPQMTAEAEAPAMMGQLPPMASKEDISYAIGFTIGANMLQEGADVDSAQLAEGIRAGLGDLESRLTPEQIGQCLFTFQMQMQQQMMQAAQDNLAEGQDYLEQNADKEGVVVTESGLQYRVIKSGNGATPTLNDMVSAHYRGTLIDGTEFDSSPEGETVSFPVGRVIPGWVEALQMMKVGDKWELTVPSSLAYGERGTQGAIGPNEVLIFELELISVEPMPEEPEMP